MDERFGREGYGRRYEDDPRFEGRAEEYPGRRYRGEGYYGGYYQPARSRGDYYGPRDERGFFDRAGDEVRSWFGDEEAERRRRQDEREAFLREPRAPRGFRRAPEYPDYEEQSRWARQWGYVERPYERAPMAEERPWTDWAGRGDAWWRGERAWEGSRERTWKARGPYTGHGPKGYQRSDERIREDICERLTEHGELDARDIEVHVAAREVTLQGSVASRADKRLVEDIVDSVSGVGEVHNQLRVNQGAEPRQIDWRHRAA